MIVLAVDFMSGFVPADIHVFYATRIPMNYDVCNSEERYTSMIPPADPLWHQGGCRGWVVLDDDFKIVDRGDHADLVLRHLNMSEHGL